MSYLLPAIIFALLLYYLDLRAYYRVVANGARIESGVGLHLDPSGRWQNDRQLVT